jgi:hypothetical protein
MRSAAKDVAFGGFVEQTSGTMPLAWIDGPLGV